MTLDGARRRQLLDALLSAFPKKFDLQQLVSFGLNQQLDAIAGADDLREVGFTLIEWAEAHGQTEALVKAALAENSGNPQLIAFVRESRPLPAPDLGPAQVPASAPPPALPPDSAPFIAGPPILHPRYFFGREREVRRWFGR